MLKVVRTKRQLTSAIGRHLGASWRVDFVHVLLRQWMTGSPYASAVAFYGPEMRLGAIWDVRDDCSKAVSFRYIDGDATAIEIWNGYSLTDVVVWEPIRSGSRFEQCLECGVVFRIPAIVRCSFCLSRQKHRIFSSVSSSKDSSSEEGYVESTEEEDSSEYVESE